jgi:hypothetical protein
MKLKIQIISSYREGVEFFIDQTQGSRKYSQFDTDFGHCKLSFTTSKCQNPDILLIVYKINKQNKYSKEDVAKCHSQAEEINKDKIFKIPIVFCGVDLEDDCCRFREPLILPQSDEKHCFVVGTYKGMDYFLLQHRLLCIVLKHEVNIYVRNPIAEASKEMGKGEFMKMVRQTLDQVIADAKAEENRTSAGS